MLTNVAYVAILAKQYLKETTDWKKYVREGGERGFNRCSTQKGTKKKERNRKKKKHSTQGKQQTKKEKKKEANNRS